MISVCRCRDRRHRFKMPQNVLFTILPWLIAIAASITVVNEASSGKPSFACGKNLSPDERTICNDEFLAQMDQAISIAFGQINKEHREAAQTTARDMLAGRHACGTDALCILDQQLSLLSVLIDLEAHVPIPPWVGRYRIKLFEHRSEPSKQELPTTVGRCTLTKIASISTRFGDELKPPVDELDSSGSAVSFANGGYQVSYSYVAAVAESHIGDEILLCLISLPKDCPPGDDRGKVYAATNLRTKETWVLPDAQHMCGGA